MHKLSDLPMEELKIVSLCRVTLSFDQITIFDTGQGMDASSENFIENWSLDFPLIAHNPVSYLNDRGCPISNQVIFYVYFIWLKSTGELATCHSHKD